MWEDELLLLLAEELLLRWLELLTEALLLWEDELLLRLAEEPLLRLEDALDDLCDDCDVVLREPLPLREALPLRDWASASPNVSEATIAATKTLRSTFFITSEF